MKLLVYIDPGFHDYLGHYYTFAKNIRESANDKKIILKHYVHRDLQQEIVNELNLIPVFEYKSYLNDSLSNEQLNKIKNSFREKLLSILDDILGDYNSFSEIVFYMYTSHPAYISSILEIIKSGRLKGYSPGKIHFDFGLFYLDNDFCLGKRNSSYENVLKELNVNLNSYDTEGFIRIHTDSELTKNVYQKIFSREIKVSPLPLHTKAFDNGGAGSSKPVRAAYFGYLTKKHGFHLISSLIKSSGREIRFFLKINRTAFDESEMIAELEKLRGLQNVEIIDKFISDEEYKSLVKSCNLIILPYLREYYPVQTSGIFSDSVMYGIPVIAPENTWMGHKLKSAGMKTVFESGSISSLKGIFEDTTGNLESIKKIIEAGAFSKVKQNLTSDALLEHLFTGEIVQKLPAVKSTDTNKKGLLLASKLENITENLIERFVKKKIRNEYYKDKSRETVSEIAQKPVAATVVKKNKPQKPATPEFLERKARHENIYSKRAKAIAGKRLFPKNKKDFIAYPAFDDLNKLSDFLNRTAFALPDKSLKITIPVTRKLMYQM
jgi:glycosyltransferase involved in cell wall biosynthesis